MMKALPVTILTVVCVNQFAAFTALANSGVPSIPEPLIFDMMRPLGAPKGELEVNTLAVAPVGGKRPRVVEYAPEIEYAFADGYAVEFELPFENSYLAEYKVGFQGTIGTGMNGKFVHGWQYLGVYGREHDEFSNDLLYMAGYRFNERWSSMNMLGMQRTDVRSSGNMNALVNHALFYDVNDDVVLGIEGNLRLGRNHDWLIVPQMHYRFTEKANVQLGAGVRQGEDESKPRPIVSARLIREF